MHAGTIIRKFHVHAYAIFCVRGIHAHTYTILHAHASEIILASTSVCLCVCVWDSASICAHAPAIIGACGICPPCMYVVMSNIDVVNIVNEPPHH